MLVECAREGCEQTFFKKTHNQLYHDNDCCKLATNKRLMQRYYEKRDRKLGKERVCSDCKVTKLNRYNDSSICSACDSKKQEESNNNVRDMILSVSWQI